MNEKFCILIQISLKFVLDATVDDKATLIQVMTGCQTGAWCQIGDKPLPEAVLTQFTDAYAALQGDELDLWISHCFEV